MVNIIDSIGDDAVRGVIEGWNTYITGEITLTILLILLFLFVIGMIFRISSAVIMIMLIPFSLFLLAYGIKGGAGIIIIILGFIVGFALYSMKR